ncbi:TlyA family RNA methyltransferase [Nocardioidaceae bacterium]|nr:TlyA family RNA methyltransferase [Nocardioidaceae bacterium]
MPRLLRLDAELVRRGLARSREQARELVLEGRVKVGGTTARKPATSVGTDADLVVVDDGQQPAYASRGGHKLASALAATMPHGLRVAGRRCLDAGASTGGFTDVLLRHGAARVLAVDVGYGQLAWSLRTDARVEVHDRTNIRALSPQLLGGDAVDLVVGDLSFISLRLVLPALTSVTAVEGDLLLMVKPQFEVGKDALGKGGVVRDPGLRAQAVHDVAAAAQELGWGSRQVVTSGLPGPSGNVEYFLWLRRDAPPLDRETLIGEVEGLDHGWIPAAARPQLSAPDEKVIP